MKAKTRPPMPEKKMGRGMVPDVGGGGVMSVHTVFPFHLIAEAHNGIIEKTK